MGSPADLKVNSRMTTTKSTVSTLIFRLSPVKEAGQIPGVGGIAHQHHIVSVVFRGNGADLVQEGIGLRPLLGEIGSKDHPGPLFPLELLESVVQGILQLLHLAGLLSAQADNPLVLLLQQELEHIQQGHGIVVRVLKDSAVFSTLRP